MSDISHETWTVVAVSDAPGMWRWRHPDYLSKAARAALLDAARADEMIVMQRRSPEGTQLVVRFAGRWWKRFQRNPNHAARRRV